MAVRPAPARHRARALEEFLLRLLREGHCIGAMGHWGIGALGQLLFFRRPRDLKRVKCWCVSMCRVGIGIFVCCVINIVSERGPRLAVRTVCDRCSVVVASLSAKAWV